MIKIECPVCKKTLEAPNESAGGKGKCPRCLETFEIPLATVPGEEENKIKCQHCGKLFSMTWAQQVKMTDVSSDTVFKCPGCLKPLNKGMADKTPELIPCPSCKKDISEAAKSCPGCGYCITPEAVEKAKQEKIKKNWEHRAGLLVMLVLAIFAVRACNSWLSHETPDAMSPAELRAFHSEMQQINANPEITEFVYYAKASINGRRLTVPIYFIDEPLATHDVEAVLVPCAHLAVSILMNQGICPKERRMQISVWGRRATLTPTGAPGVQLFGAARYSSITDSIEFTPYNR